MFAPVSYKDLTRQIEDVRRRFRQAGLGRDARIAVGIANSATAAWSIVTTACSAAAIPLDPKLTAAEVERCFHSVRPSAVLLSEGTPSAARSIAERLALPIIESKPTAPGQLELALSVPRIAATSEDGDPDPDKPAFILHTSGTTADPHLVPFSHRNVLASAERVQKWFDLRPEDRCLSVSPIYYSHALTTTLLPPLLTGGGTAFPANAMTVDLAEWLGALRPTWYSCGPTVHLAVLDKARAQPGLRMLHSLRLISSAGAPIARTAQEEMEQVLGVPVLQHYGSSETAHIASNRPGPGLSKPDTCGMPWPGIVKIVAEDGNEAGPGEHGEILVRGPSITSGYLNAPELNAFAFRDGWYRTGDIGSLDHEGFLSLHARRREIISRGAEKIAPQAIDEALMEHPDVMEAAAFGVPHPNLGEDVAAAVVLRPGTTVGPEALRAFAGERLAGFKVPRRIFVVARLPKGITGKVQRARLSEFTREELLSLAPKAIVSSRWLKLLAFIRFDLSSADGTERPRTSAELLSEDALHVEVLKIWKRLLRVEHANDRR